jgi:glycosyltransferase involved in cell wall biosynthesis
MEMETSGLEPADLARRFPRVALIHYWFVTMRGGERVVERILRLFPHAEIFTHVYDEKAVSQTIRSHNVHTTFIQRLPGAKRHYQKYLPLMPMALEALDLRGYDLVISSESGPAKGVICAPDAFHLSYVHSPMRYIWDQYHQYRDASGLVTRALMPMLCHRLRQWDMASAARVDQIVANSNYVRSRIAKSWGRAAEVVHPPVEVDLFRHHGPADGPYLWASQLVPYKRPDIAIEAFNRLKLPLVVVGDGPLAPLVRRMAGPTIKLVSRLNFTELRAAYANARALVFTAEEDFGMIPVEVMASGRPVLAYGKGGVLDSVRAESTGLFFREQTVDSLIDGIARMEKWLPHFDPAAAVAQAARFSPEQFDAGILRQFR